MPRVLRALCGLLALSVVACLGPVLTASPAAASVTILCKGYDGCKAQGMGHGGYKAASSSMYWRMYAGHNCTNYVAYRMVKSGLPNVRPWTGSGNAMYWGVSMPRITDAVPSVGAVAWWEANVKGASGSSGHVAYVERVVSADEIIVSQDSWGGDFSWARIVRTGGAWPSGFIHFNDLELKNTLPPALSGTPRVGMSLTVSPGTWKQAGVTVAYQWLADGLAIPGATASTLALTQDLQDKVVSVRTRPRCWASRRSSSSLPPRHRSSRATSPARWRRRSPGRPRWTANSSRQRAGGTPRRRRWPTSGRRTACRFRAPPRPPSRLVPTRSARR